MTFCVDSLPSGQTGVVIIDGSVQVGVPLGYATVPSSAPSLPPPVTSSSGGVDVAIIAGAAAGGFVVLGLVIIAVCWAVRRNRHGGMTVMKDSDYHQHNAAGDMGGRKRPTDFQFINKSYVGVKKYELEMS